MWTLLLFLCLKSRAHTFKTNNLINIYCTILVKYHWYFSFFKCTLSKWLSTSCLQVRLSKLIFCKLCRLPDIKLLMGNALCWNCCRARELEGDLWVFDISLKVKSIFYCDIHVFCIRLRTNSWVIIILHKHLNVLTDLKSPFMLILLVSYIFHFHS